MLLVVKRRVGDVLVEVIERVLFRAPVVETVDELVAGRQRVGAPEVDEVAVLAVDGHDSDVVDRRRHGRE